MHRHGYSSRQIAEIFSRCNSTISRLVKRCVETGSKDNLSRNGRPSKMSAGDERELVSIVRNDRRQTLSDIVGMFNQ